VVVEEAFGSALQEYGMEHQSLFSTPQSWSSVKMTSHPVQHLYSPPLGQS